MSLAQHVSSIEGVDRHPTEWLSPDDPEPSKAVRRILSYDAFPPSQNEDHLDHVAAYKVSATKRAGWSNSIISKKNLAHSNDRAVQVAITVLACWLASGIVFGYAALKPVLLSEDVYRDLCTAKELQEDVDVCLEQDIR
jgi:hypothetical protein